MGGQFGRHEVMSGMAFMFSPEGAGETASTGTLEHGSGSLNWFDFSNEEAPPLFALFINFILVGIAVYYILRKSIKARFKNRRQILETEIAEAREMKKRAEQALLTAEEKMKFIDVEMTKIREEILNGDAAAIADQQIAKMAHELRREIVEEISRLAEKMISERIDNNDHQRLTEEYLIQITPRSSLPAKGWDSGMGPLT
jgi:F0F1-type ATP synthase membrane subunit b/b'